MSADLRIAAAIAARGPEWAAVVAARREQERLRDARRRQKPERLEQERRRKAAARARPEQAAIEREQRRLRTKPRPFLAIDGEGAGADKAGRQNYVLMKAAGAVRDMTLRHSGGAALSTTACLEFIASQPAGHILVAYGLNYDANQILRGILASAPETMQCILKPRYGKNGPWPEFWGDFAIVYQPWQYLSVARIDRTGERPAIAKGSTRTVFDVLGLFQAPFVNALKSWGIGTDDERALIKRNKDLRDEFAALTDEMIDYCTLECRLLAEMMEKLRGACTAAGIRPRRWSSAGWLAAALFQQHNVPKRPETERETELAAQRQQPAPGLNRRPPRTELRRPERQPALETAAARGYAGGRVEISDLGYIRGPVYQYDLHGAYPAAMPRLPCPMHTAWVNQPWLRRLPKDGVYLALVSFRHPSSNRWGSFPFRTKGSHAIYFPLDGTGWYWSFEIEAAKKNGGEILLIHDLWVAKAKCKCSPFGWVPEIYDRRQALDNSHPGAGTPLKLAMAAFYGKVAQRIGRAPWHDTVAAGLICAITRGRVLEAVATDPEAIVMIATDAIYSTRKLPLDIGPGLGQWSETEWPDLFIVKPGVYWSPASLEASLKTRGTARSFIGKAAPRFRAAFEKFLPQMKDQSTCDMILVKRRRAIPPVPVTVRVFYGVRYAMLAKKPWLAGKWDNREQRESFEWRGKRDAYRVEVGETAIKTFPRIGELLTESAGYTPVNFDEIAEEQPEPEEEDMAILLEGLPDQFVFLPHEE